MFNILWVEDEVGWVEELGPTLAKIPGVSLTVLLLDTASGVNIPGIRIIEVGRENLTIDVVWKHLQAAFNLYHPWLVITDLKLDPVLKDPNTYEVGGHKAAGINLTLHLIQKTDCRNIIWLTNYSLAVLSNIGNLVISTWRRGQVKIIFFPRTFVVDKTNCEREMPELIEDMTKEAVSRLLKSKAIYHIEGSRIALLFRLLLSSGSVAHFFTTSATRSAVHLEAFEEAKQKLRDFDLIPFHDPPMSFPAWLMAWDPHGPLLEALVKEDARVYAEHLVGVLGRSLWGMTVSELPELLHYTAREHNVNTDLLDINQIDLIGSDIPEGIVVGPIARNLLVCALGNSLQNAQRYGNGAKVFLGCHLTPKAIYLIVGNEVDDFDKTFDGIIEKGKNKQLRGIHFISSAIDGLNQLHEQQSRNPEMEGWGSWGYATFAWNNESKRVRSFQSEAFSTGNLKQNGEGTFEDEILKLYSVLGEKWDRSGVMSVFHLPLVRTVDLAQRTPSPEPVELVLRTTL